MPRGELYALIRTMQLDPNDEGIVIISDCQLVVDTANPPALLNKALLGDNGGLWEDFRLELLKRSNLVVVSWTDAHASGTHLFIGTVSRFRFIGIAYADALANIASVAAALPPASFTESSRQRFLLSASGRGCLQSWGTFWPTVPPKSVLKTRGL